jgi:hypothetical protein
VPSFCRLYPQHSSPHSLDAAYQRQQLFIILAGAQTAEDEVQQVQDIACGLINQGIFSAASGAQAHPSQAETRATAYPSQAEKTFTQYGTPPDGGKTSTKKIQHCWGCNGDHSWRTGKNIVCPCKNDPAAQAKAKREYKDWLRSTKKRKAGNKTVEFKDIPEDQQKKMRKAVLASDASTAASTITGGTVPSGQSVVFLLSVPEPVPVPSNAPIARFILPVPVQAAFPHITIQLGRDLGCPKCPSIRCVIDTATTLSTGNFHFFAQIAKAFPHTVSAIYSNNNYSPIILSGIVQQDGAPVSTDLMVTFQFTMPYLTREGHATSLLIATGHDVTVNTILGLPFIQQTRMVIDASDQVVDIGTLDTPPFPIDFRCTMCTVPALPPNIAPGPTSSNCAIVLKEIACLEAFFAGNVTPTKPEGILLPSKPLRKVGFVAGPTSPASSTSDSSTIITVGSELEPDFALDADDSDSSDLHPLSA